MLLLAATPSSTPDGSSPEDSRSLYNVDGSPFHGAVRVPFPPEYNDKRCCGSSHGWLALAAARKIKMGNTEKYVLSVTLLNPFTGATILLPPLRSKEFYYYKPSDYHCLVVKVVLSADPALAPDTFEAVAIYLGMYRLAHYKSGAKRWTYVSRRHILDTVYNEDGSPVIGKRKPLTALDVIYYRGKFYAANNRGWVVSIESDERNNLKLKTVLPWRPPTHGGSYRIHLAESSRGEVLLVQTEDAAGWVRTHEEDVPDQEWKVYKVMDSSGRTCDHECVDSLGEDALFVGDNTSLALAVSASGFPSGCRPNCIYYTHDDTPVHYLHCIYCPQFPSPEPLHMGFYCLEDGAQGTHYRPLSMDPSHKLLSPEWPPIWIEPPSLHL